MVETYNNLAQLLIDHGRPRKALDVLYAALALPELPVQWQAWLSGSLATLHHQYGQRGTARPLLLDAVRRCADEELTTDQYVYTLLAEHQALSGKSETAEDTLAQINRIYPSETESNAAQLAFTRGVLAWAAGEAAGAERAFQTALQDDLLPWDQLRASAYLLAGCLQAGSDPAAALHGLEAAVTAYDTAAPLLTDEDALPTVWAFLRGQSGWAARLRSLEALRWLSAHITVRADLYGSPRLLTDRGELRVPLKKAFELLLYLVLNGPSTRGALIAALWNGDASSQAREYFKMSVKRLREALSVLDSSALLKFELGRYRLSERLRWETSVNLRATFPETLLAFVPGIGQVGLFLEGIDSEWVVDVRAQAQVLLIRQVLNVAEHAPDDAPTLAMLEQLRGLDPWDEALTRAVAAGHRAAGRPQEAQTVLDAFRAGLPD